MFNLEEREQSRLGSGTGNPVKWTFLTHQLSPRPQVLLHWDHLTAERLWEMVPEGSLAKAQRIPYITPKTPSSSPCVIRVPQALPTCFWLICSAERVTSSTSGINETLKQSRQVSEGTPIKSRRCSACENAVVFKENLWNLSKLLLLHTSSSGELRPSKSPLYPHHIWPAVSSSSQHLRLSPRLKIKPVQR